MDKKRLFGRYFYYGMIIISIILVILAIVFMNVRNTEDEDLIFTRLIYRYMIIVSVLYIFIPIGCIVREVTTCEYKRNLIIIKTLLAILSGIGALLLIYYIKNLQVAKVATMIGTLILVFSASPTKREEKKL